MNAFRWWLFRRLSELGWWICPEPHKSVLQASMSFDKTMWEDPDTAFAEYLAGKEASHDHPA